MLTINFVGSSKISAYRLSTLIFSDLSSIMVAKTNLSNMESDEIKTEIVLHTQQGLILISYSCCIIMEMTSSDDLIAKLK